MKPFLIQTIILFLGLGFWVLSCQAGQGEKVKQAEYDALMAKVKNSDESVDFARLRQLATELDSYAAADHGPSRNNMFAALQRGDYKEAMKLAEKDLAANYLDVDAHIGAMAAAKGIGAASQEAHHRYVAKGIIDSILRSGDGKTPETAFKVIAINEEYATLRVLGLQVQGQALSHAGGHNFDIMTAVDPETKSKREGYFNIDPIWAAESKNFGK